MRNVNTFRMILPLAGLTVGFLLNASLASAQRPEGPGQGGPRPEGLGDRRGPGGPNGPRPGGPGPPGLPSGFVPGDFLAQYLSLTDGQQQKLTHLMKTMDALTRENVEPQTLGLLKLTEDQMRKIAAGSKLTDVLTADQQQMMNAHKRQGRPGSPGGPGGLGGLGQSRPEGPGGPEDRGGPQGDPPPPQERSEATGAAAPIATQPLAPGVVRVPVTFSGGHDTDPRDGGRPVVLVAHGLGVAPEVFREAFSHVHPAHNGTGPTSEQAQQNKAALMNALGKYGIDNDRLDQVSNYYRYVRSRNELWTHSPAVANALVKNGSVVGFEILRAGAGYSSAPTVTIPNVRTGNAVAKLAFSTSLPTNGSIASITFSQSSN